MTKISLKDKTNLALISLKKNAPVLLRTIPFILIGAAIIYFTI
jgi:DNA polymerase/3'-5' exonuclease PolX